MSAKLRQNLPALPARMRALRIDARGYPVPFFVKWVDGKPDFRLTDPEKFMRCVRFNRCWICGEELGAKKTFVLGPLNTMNRVTSEPPSHWECSMYAVLACPFLLLPKAQMQAVTGTVTPGFIDRNPGVSALWSTKRFDMLDERLIQVGEPTQVWWWSKGQLADRSDVLDSFETGLTILWKRAKNQANYSDFCIEIERQWAEVQQYIPRRYE